MFQYAREVSTFETMWQETLIILPGVSLEEAMRKSESEQVDDEPVIAMVISGQHVGGWHSRPLLG